MATKYRFSFGPWNISEGADPFGPEVRSPYSLQEKFDMYGPLGFEGVQFHDDDVVENIDDHAPEAALARAREVKKMLDDRGWFPSLSPRDSGSIPARSMEGLRATLRTTANMQSTAVCGQSISHVK